MTTPGDPAGQSPGTGAGDTGQWWTNPVPEAPAPPSWSPALQPAWTPPPPPYGQQGWQQPPPQPPRPPRLRPQLKGLLWALAGMAAVSVVWVAGVAVAQAVGDSGAAGTSAAPANRGYRYTTSLCAKTDHSEVLGWGYKLSAGSSEASNPIQSSSNEEALAIMRCETSFDRTSADKAFLNVYAILNKKTDPAAEFEADVETLRTRPQLSDIGLGNVSYTISPIAGLGDKAYAAVGKGNGNDTIGTRHVIVLVRDGELAYQATWLEFGWREGATTMDQDKVSAMLQAMTRKTIPALRG